MAYGTHAVADLLATTQQSIVDFGEDRVNSAIQAALAAYNAQVDDMFGTLVETTTDRRRRYGGLDTMAMDEVDEFGRADAQKVTTGVTLDFPLRLYEISVQWTRKYMENNTPAELAQTFLARQLADLTTIQREIKRALFRSANYTSVDRFVDQTALSVKRLVNADSAAIPLGPQGETFNAATHTHYLATASFVAADMNALIETVVEHYGAGQPRVYINRAQETAVRALTGFYPYTIAQLANATAGIVANGGDLAQTDLNNREIGVYTAGGVSAIVTVKPWIPASYLFAWMDGAPAPLVRRIRRAGAGGLVVAADDEAHPLRAQTMEREHGFGVWTRTNGAVLYVGGGTYTDPTLN